MKKETKPTEQPTEKTEKTQETQMFQVHQAEKPFSIVERNRQFYVTIGNNVMTEKTFSKLKEAESYIAHKPYELIINATICVMELNKQLKK